MRVSFRQFITKLESWDPFTYNSISVPPSWGMPLLRARRKTHLKTELKFLPNNWRMLNSVQLDIISHSSLLSKSNLQIAFYNANARPYQILFDKHKCSEYFVLVTWLICLSFHLKDTNVLIMPNSTYQCYGLVYIIRSPEIPY